MDRDDDEHQDKIRRFEQAVHELIDEGHSLFDYHGLLERAAERAGVDRQKLLCREEKINKRLDTGDSVLGVHPFRETVNCRVVFGTDVYLSGRARSSG